MLEKANPQLRSDKKVNDSATQTHPTQRRTQAKLSHACTIRSAMHAEPTKWRTQAKISHTHTHIKLTYAHNLASDLHTKQAQPCTRNHHTFRVYCAQRSHQEVRHR